MQAALLAGKVLKVRKYTKRTFTVHVYSGYRNNKNSIPWFLMGDVSCAACWRFAEVGNNQNLQNEGLVYPHNDTVIFLSSSPSGWAVPRSILGAEEGKKRNRSHTQTHNKNTT